MLKLLLSPLVMLLACQTTPAPIPSEPPPAKPDFCDVFNEQIPLRYSSPKPAGFYSLKMPATGPVAHESHYLIAGLDGDPGTSVNALTTPHLARTCGLLRGAWEKFYPGLKAGCAEVYGSSSAREWTPAEGGGAVGHGSVGRLFPSVECEAAEFNMFWQSADVRDHVSPLGTRFLAYNPTNGRAFVLCSGYETGPGDKRLIGGMSTEAMWYLQAEHGKTVLTLGRATDQSLPYGPLVCGPKQ